MSGKLVFGRNLHHSEHVESEWSEEYPSARFFCGRSAIPLPIILLLWLLSGTLCMGDKAMPRKRPTASPVSWMNMAMLGVMLGVECQQVVWLRLIKFAVGGTHAEEECRLMISEKMAAPVNAGKSLMFGASQNNVVNGYHKVVRANLRRLSKT